VPPLAHGQLDAHGMVGPPTEVSDCGLADHTVWLLHRNSLRVDRVLLLLEVPGLLDLHVQAA
jgi:hypothetical protein